MSGSTQVGGISVPIFAVDNATAVINRVSRNIGGLVPLSQRFNQSTGRAGANVLGINRLADGMASLGVRTRDTFQSLERIAPEIGLITGAVTLGGLLALETRFANVGQQAANLGQRLGVPVGRLTELQGAARLGGVSADDMSESLTALDESLRGATFRFDPQKIQAFNALNVSFGSIGKGARNSAEALDDVADGIKRLYDSGNRGGALHLAQSLGIERLFPLLVKGGAEIERYRAKVIRLGGGITPEMAQRSEKLREGFESVGLAAQGFANKLADAVSPQFTRMSEGFATWIEKHAPRFSAWIGTLATRFEKWVDNLDFTKVDAAFERFFHWVDQLSQKDFSAFGQQIIDIANAFGRAAEAAYRWLQYLGAIPASGPEGGVPHTPFGPENNPELHGISSGGGEEPVKLDPWEKTSNGLMMRRLRDMSETYPENQPSVFERLRRKWFPGLYRKSYEGDFLGPSPLFGPKGEYLNHYGLSYEERISRREAGPPPGDVSPWGLLTTPAQSRIRWRHEAAQLDPRIEAEVRRDASLAGLKQDHMVALFRQEHGGFDAVSPAGAFGPAMLMPATANKWGVANSVDNPAYDWRKNVLAGISEYREQLDRFGDYSVADAAYNAGPNNAGVKLFARTGSQLGLPHETQDYVDKIREMTRGADNQGQVNVTVDVNVPQGTTATGKATSSGIAQTSPVKIGVGMPHAGAPLSPMFTN